jgi:hypothetical protein
MRSGGPRERRRTDQCPRTTPGGPPASPAVIRLAALAVAPWHHGQRPEAYKPHSFRECTSAMTAVR